MTQFEIVVYSVNMDSGKRKRLSIRDKMNVIAASEQHNFSVRKLAGKFCVGKTQVSDILKNKSEIKKFSRRMETWSKKGNFQKRLVWPLMM